MRAWLTLLIAKATALFRRRRDTETLSEEIELHLRLLEERYRARGLSAEAARREARVAFGGAQQLHEAHQDQRTSPWIAEAGQDMRYAWRMLRRQPGFAATAVLTLALGIGASTAVFSVVHAVILRPLPYAEPDRVERIGWQWNQRNTATGALSAFKFAYLREHAKAFEAIATWQLATVEVENAQPLNVLRVSEDFLGVVGISPSMGRGFGPDEYTTTGTVALLTSRSWQQRFGADPNVLGRTIAIGDQAATVVGVLPPAFEFPEEIEDIDVVVPLALRPDPADLGANSPSLARLRAGVTRAAAEDDLNRVFGALRTDRPAQFSSPDERGVLMSFEEIHLSDVTRPLWTLFAGVSVVLLIACTNVANLLLARGTTRMREMMVRGALGASRSRLLRQGIAEGLVISGLGAIIGVAFGTAAVRALISLAPGSVARLDQVRVDSTVMAFAVVIVAIAGAVFGVAANGLGALPQAAKVTSLATRGATMTRTGRRVRHVMIGLESALAMVLVAGAVLLATGFYRLTQTPLGFNPSQVVAVTFGRMPAGFDNPARLSAATRVLSDALAATPGVEAVALANVAPLGERGWNMPMTVDGRPDATEGAIEWRVVSPEYAEVLRLRLVRGRWLTAEDVTSARPVVVVTANFASRYFPDSNAVGQRIWPGVFRGERRSNSPAVAHEIVGVVEDIRDLGPTRTVRRTAFLPHSPSSRMPTFLVRTSGEVSAGALLVSVHGAEPALPDPMVSTMAARLGSRLERDRFSSLLMTLFAIVALVLTAVGVYGVVSWIVRHGVQELGIRLALGASRPQILAGVVFGGLRPVAVGLVAGAAIVLSASGLFDGLVVGATTVSIRVTAGAAALLLAAAAAAAWIPARRALAVDPAIALRAG